MKSKREISAMEEKRSAYTNADVAHLVRNGVIALESLCLRIRQEPDKAKTYLRSISHRLEQMLSGTRYLEDMLPGPSAQPRVKVFRMEQTAEGALGTLVLDGRIFCATLEPDANDPERDQIPAGRFKCRRFHGTKFPNTFEIVVPGHTAVLFHPGNTEQDTTMCVLLGRYAAKLREARAVMNSGLTFSIFMDRLKDMNEFEAEFTNLF